jgi:CDP-glycerol glycerophosphotransferase (TagB/SpsB family)
MVLAYYLRKCPYSCGWHSARLLNRTVPVVAYCSCPLDYVVLLPVLKHLPPLPWVAKDHRTASFLEGRGVRPYRTPSFPEAVIMCRHATHRFPLKRIVKIGFRHGAYHFKQFAKPRYYNAFDVYFVTGRHEEDEARAHGIRTAQAVGFPKLDPAFDGTYRPETLHSYREAARIDAARKTVLFTATWDRSGMSAVGKWIDRVDSLAEHYNVIVTVHPWTSGKYKTALRVLKHACFIEDPDVIPYLLIADVLVGDASSIVAEFCALDKPIVTFEVPRTARTVPDVAALLERISTRISSAEQLPGALAESLAHPEKLSAERQRANEMMFDRLDGQAGKRAADVIRMLVPSLV